MKCPCCGEIYENDIKICPSCGNPLGNAIYTPIITPEKKSHKKIILTFIFVLLSTVSCVSLYAYHQYLAHIKTECKKKTEKIFTAAKAMDFSDISTNDLPDFFKENPDIKGSISSSIDEIISEGRLGSILSESGVSFDNELILKQITSNSSYKITKVEASYNTCKLTVTSGNLDYSDVLKKTGEDLTSAIKNDKSIWTGISETVSEFLLGIKEQNEKISEKVSDTIPSLLEENIANAERLSYTSTISFKLQNGKWKLADCDEKLFYTFYGMPEDNKE